MQINRYLKDLTLMIFISWLIHCLLLLLSVAFFTLFERKVIGLFHLRVGPNKVSFIGLVQPLLDAFKLLSKQNLTPFRANKLVYNMAPIIGLFLAIFVWLTIPNYYILLSINYSLVLFFLSWVNLSIFCINIWMVL